MGGGDKCLLEIAGRPMLAHVIDRIGPTADLVAINANGDPARFAAFALPVIGDNSATFDGPLAGVFAAMNWAQNLGFDRVLTAAADTPFFPRDLAARLARAARPPTIAVAASRGRLHPAFALWPTALAREVEDQLATGQRRLGSFIDNHASIRVDVTDTVLDGESVDPFFNVNTPQDLAEARLIADRLAP